MRIYVINLDRHSKRMARMESALSGLDFERIKAVDGATLDGPEIRLAGPATSFDELTRYERACVASHASAMQYFLQSGESHACIMEDDVALSPDFPRFMQSSRWMPTDCGIMKIETQNKKLLMDRRKTPCLDRSAVSLHSVHLGSAGYVVNRAGAKQILQYTTRPARPMDRLLFDLPSQLTNVTIYQLMPALCQQLHFDAHFTITTEFQSSIQASGRGYTRPQKTIGANLVREIIRPEHQLRDIGRWSELGYPLRVSHRLVAFR